MTTHTDTLRESFGTYEEAKAFADGITWGDEPAFTLLAIGFEGDEYRVEFYRTEDEYE